MKSGDVDGDGASNEQEMFAETSPRNATDLLKVQAQQAGSLLMLTWPSKIGRSYQIYASGDFKSWIPASDLVAGTGQRVQLSLPVAAWNQMLAYRVRVQDQ